MDIQEIITNKEKIYYIIDTCKNCIVECKIINAYIKDGQDFYKTSYNHCSPGYQYRYGKWADDILWLFETEKEAKPILIKKLMKDIMEHTEKIANLYKMINNLEEEIK